MKKLQFNVLAMVIMALVCVGFASCGSDDDNKTSGASSELVGIWTQYHREGNSSWYEGVKLDADGSFAYTEWQEGREPNWGYTGGAHWSASGGVITIVTPDGSKTYTASYKLSPDGKTITVSGYLEGEFVKQ